MFNIVYGHDSALLKGIKYKAGASIPEGIWVVYDQVSGGLVPQTGDYDPFVQGVAYPVYGGNTVRFDSKQLGAVTVCQGKSFVAETDKVAAVSIKIGDPLTIKDGILTKAVSGNTVVAYCQSPNTAGKITFTRD